MPLKSNRSPSRLTRQEALDILPDVLIGLLRHQIKAKVLDRGAGPKNRQVLLTGKGIRLFLHIDDWNNISDNISFDPETVDTLGVSDPNAPPTPDQIQPWQLGGSLLPWKGPTSANRRYNPRTPINRQLLLRNDGSFRAYLTERIKEIFV